MITLYYDFTFLNEFIALTNKASYGNGKNYNPANKVKRDTTNFVYYAMLNKPKIQTPCKIKFTWLVKNKQRDLDNISFAKKYILDGLVKAKLIPNDNLTHITGFTDEYEIHDKVGVRIEIY